LSAFEDNCAHNGAFKRLKVKGQGAAKWPVGAYDRKQDYARRLMALEEDFKIELVTPLGKCLGELLGSLGSVRL
jgi:hypothetical protein